MREPPDSAKQRFEAGLAARNFEIAFLWQRATFFWAFIAAAFAGFGVASTNEHHAIAVLIGIFGAFASFSWTLVNRGSKYWFEVWETRTKELEVPVIGKLYGAPLPELHHSSRWLRARRYSVSRVLIAVSDFVTILWVVALAGELVLIYHSDGEEGPFGISAQVFDHDVLLKTAIGILVTVASIFALLMWRDVKEHSDSECHVPEEPMTDSNAGTGTDNPLGPEHFQLAWMLGSLVAVFSRLEGALFTLASLPLVDDEPRYVAKRTVAQLVDDIRALSADGLYLEQTPKLLEILSDLDGTGGIVKRRNRLIHSVWRWDATGAISRQNIRATFLQNPSVQPDTDFDPIELFVLAGTVAHKADALNEVLQALRDDYL